MTAQVHAAASLLRVGIVKRPYSLIYRSHDLDLMIIIEMDYRSGIAVAVGRSHTVAGFTNTARPSCKS
jgi:hypothetical protein